MGIGGGVMKKYYFSLIDFDIASNFSKHMSKERHEELTSKLKEFLAEQRAKHPPTPQ